MAGFSARNLLCESKCEFREKCLVDGYLSQFELPPDDQSRIYVTTHQSAKNWAEYFGPDVIVFDEYPIGINITQNELTQKDVADYRSCVKKLNGQNFKLVLIFLKTLSISFLERILGIPTLKLFIYWLHKFSTSSASSKASSIDLPTAT